MRIFSGKQATWVFGLGLSLMSLRSLAAPAVGNPLPTITLSGDAGGRVDGKAWSSEMLKDKVWMIFYVAPSHRDDNQALKDALHAEAFPNDKYGSVAVINMASSWLPNSIIASALQANQEKYPLVTYVKDMNKALVTQWHLADNAFAMLLLDSHGTVISAKEGDFSKDEIVATIALIKKAIAAH